MENKVLIEIILAFSKRTITQKITINKGTKVSELLKNPNLHDKILEAFSKTNRLAINGEKINNDYELVKSERLIVLRPLFLDPKEMRRKRLNKL
ncbi:MAG: hypothetical protein CBD16_02235 [Betaproteobacteria bacterium TMED156]|nr:MAG: hypothetical protein CBD16_02235 [Betaproteobacteria bacterium TMED156]|tara:strand:- start:219 stop:500 length:282 start_codon:yes stop_codon:yes gene_type:complete